MQVGPYRFHICSYTKVANQKLEKLDPSLSCFFFCQLNAFLIDQTRTTARSKATMLRSSSSSSSRPLSSRGEAGSTSNTSHGSSPKLYNGSSPSARNGTNGHGNSQYPARNAKSRESLGGEDDDWLSSIDEALATATDSPPTSDPDERVNATLKPPSRGFAHMAPPHLPGARPPSPTTSALSAGPSNLSSAFTRVSISQAARDLQPGVVPRPIKRDSLYTSQRANGADPIRIARTLPRTLPHHPSSGLPRHPNLPARPRVGPNGPHSIPPANFPIRPIRRHFEIRISNLPHGIRKDDLEHLLADATLHRAPFSYKNKKLNFW